MKEQGRNRVLISCLLLAAFGSPWAVPAATVDGERLFGYAGISSEQHLREVSPFSNIVMLNPLWPSFGRLVKLARERDMRVAIAWDHVLFDTSEPQFRLRPDHRQRLESLVSSTPALYRDLVFQQPVDEPYWHGLSDEDVEQAIALLEEAFPGVPTLIVMAWPVLDVRVDPVPSDWVAFDLYFVADPVTDPRYQFYWNRMRALNPGKPIVVVADGFYTAAHAAAGLSQDDMGAVMRAYQALYESEPRAVALGVFQWADGENLGSRSLPASVLRVQIGVGSSITGRCGIAPNEDPLAGETILWFHDCRFYARLDIDDPRSAVETATGASLSEESGYFWFFNDSNVELSVKVLDGTGINGYYWVFMSDTTDVNYRLEIRDVETGRTWSHLNQGGAVSVRRDVTAFLP